jgi:hypothetical protein
MVTNFPGCGNIRYGCDMGDKLVDVGTVPATIVQEDNRRQVVGCLPVVGLLIVEMERATRSDLEWNADGSLCQRPGLRSQHCRHHLEALHPYDDFDCTSGGWRLIWETHID